MRIPTLLALTLALLAGPLVAQDEGDSNPGLREVPDSGDAIPEPEADGQDDADDTEYWDGPRRHRPSYWVSGGLGAAGLAVRMNRAPLDYSPRQTVPSLSLAFGVTPDPHLQLGVEMFSWFNFAGNETVESVVMAMLGGRIHPVPGSGLYLRGSAGLGIYSLEWEDSWLDDWVGDDCYCDSPIDMDTGFAWSIGAGYQAPVGRHLRLGPTVELLHMQVGGPDGYHQRIVNFGITLTFDSND